MRFQIIFNSFIIIALLILFFFYCCRIHEENNNLKGNIEALKNGLSEVKMYCGDLPEQFQTYDRKAWSPNCDYIAYTSESGTYLYNVQSDKTKLVNKNITFARWVDRENFIYFNGDPENERTDLYTITE